MEFFLPGGGSFSGTTSIPVRGRNIIPLLYNLFSLRSNVRDVRILCEMVSTSSNLTKHSFYPKTIQMQIVVPEREHVPVWLTLVWKFCCEITKEPENSEIRFSRMVRKLSGNSFTFSGGTGSRKFPFKFRSSFWSFSLASSPLWGQPRGAVFVDSELQETAIYRTRSEMKVKKHQLFYKTKSKNLSVLYYSWSWSPVVSRSFPVCARTLP